MKGLTKRQRELTDFIVEFIVNKGYSPSYREIGQHFGFSSLGSVYKHLAALKRRGVIDQDSGSSRSITPTVDIHPTQLDDVIEIPFIGELVANEPPKIFPNTQLIAVSKTMLRHSENAYILQVKGDFLNEDSIFNGDLLIVEVNQKVEQGDTVIALINEADIIIKKYFIEKNIVTLLSSSGKHNPIELRPEDIAIQGVVVGLMRKY